MNNTQFESLPKKLQLKYLSLFGVPLTERVLNGNRFFLYAVNSFYVEVWYELSNINEHRIRIHRIITDTEHLDQYLIQIDIGELSAFLNRN